MQFKGRETAAFGKLSWVLNALFKYKAPPKQKI